MGEQWTPGETKGAEAVRTPRSSTFAPKEGLPEAPEEESKEKRKSRMGCASLPCTRSWA